MVAALLLCGLLGWSGAHRFYLGKFVTGAVQASLMLLLAGWIIADFPYRNGDVNYLLLLGQLMAVFVVNLWPSVDFYRIISGRLTDGDGRILTE